MADLLDLPATLERWGLTVVPVTGWQDRRRPGRFDPIGVLIHHTAAPGPKDNPSLQVCIDGRTDLPGPLCQLLVARSGKVYVISAHRCNHAGSGGPIGPIGVDQGNTQLVGIEAENDGLGETWPPVQLNAMVRATAAVLDLLDQRRSHVWGHKEYTPRKPDPRGIDMTQFRGRVVAVAPPKETTVPTPADANPYPAETAEALELLAQHAGYVGDRKWFGPDALAALHRLKIRAEDLATKNINLAGHNVTLASERDTAVANREAAEAEVAMLRKQLQEGGRLPTLLAAIDMASTDIGRAWDDLNEAIAKARA